jgi:uncharacterized protein YjbJ (UPF0337 family)
MGIGDDDKAEGKWDKAKGKVKKAVGELTDDKSLKREGSADKAKGSFKDAKGDVKNKIDEGLDNIYRSQCVNRTRRRGVSSPGAALVPPPPGRCRRARLGPWA